MGKTGVLREKRRQTFSTNVRVSQLTLFAIHPSITFFTDTLERAVGILAFLSLATLAVVPWAFVNIYKKNTHTQIRRCELEHKSVCATITAVWENISFTKNETLILVMRRQSWTYPVLVILQIKNHGKSWLALNLANRSGCPSVLLETNNILYNPLSQILAPPGPIYRTRLICCERDTWNS